MTMFGVEARMGYYILIGTVLFIGSYFLISYIFTRLAITNSFLQILLSIAIVSAATSLLAFTTKKTWKKTDWDR